MGGVNQSVDTGGPNSACTGYKMAPQGIRAGTQRSGTVEC